MSREELALELRRAMNEKDLTIKEVAFMASRSIGTIQRVRDGVKVSERTFTKVRAVMLSF